MSEIISKKLWLTDNPENPYYTKLLCDLILAIGTFSKGFPFSVKKNNNNIDKYFAEPLNMIFQILEISPENTLIRAKTIFFLHR